jgi:hypothetical protein
MWKRIDPSDPRLSAVDRTATVIYCPDMLLTAAIVGIADSVIAATCITSLIGRLVFAYETGLVVGGRK